jgi:hypothetical protein
LGGTCVLLERLLEKKIFYLLCRHNIHEIILTSIFEKKLSKSSRKDVPIFKQFQYSWDKLNIDNLSPGILDKE